MVAYTPNYTDQARAVLPLAIEVARGRNDDFSLFTLQMYNGAVINAVETLWPESTRYSAWLTTLTTMTISSSSASDAAAGTGARTVTITGLDSNFNRVSSTVTLNGTTAVTIPVQFLRVNFINVVTAGTGLTNAGILYVGTGTITAGKPAVVHALVEAGVSVSRSGIYTVPLNNVLHLSRMNIGTHTTAGRVAVRTRPPGSSVFTSICEFHVMTPITLDLSDLDVVTAGTDVEVTCFSTTATARDFSGYLSGFLRKE